MNQKECITKAFSVYPLGFGNYSRIVPERFQEGSVVVLQVEVASDMW